MPFSFINQPSLIAYLTCGDPDLRTTREVALAAISAGAAMIELGMPFSDPVADGPVIQRASERALKNGTNLEQVLKLAAEIREESQSAGLIVFSYLNPILRMGMEKFCKISRHAGLDGVLITDLPVEESESYVRAAKAHDLATIFLAAPTSTDERLKHIAEVSSGFVYAVSRTGVTGAHKELAEDAKMLVSRLKVYRPADCGWVWHFGAKAVRRSWKVCGWGRNRKRDCAGGGNESGQRSCCCGRIYQTAFSRQAWGLGHQEKQKHRRMSGPHFAFLPSCDRLRYRLRGQLNAENFHGYPGLAKEN